MPHVTEIKACRLCQSEALDKVLSLRPTPIGDSYFTAERHPEKLPSFPLDLNQCRLCGHVQLGSLVDPGKIYSNYIYTTSISLGLKEHFQNYAQTVCAKMNLRKGSFVVDIGSNDGTLLRAFQERGMRVLGVDPAQAIAKKASEDGIPTINAFFDQRIAADILRSHGQADLVIANNVVANVWSPRAFVQGVKELLSENGFFVWETGYLKYLTEGCVFDNIHHEHIDYYAVRPLIDFYRNFDLQLQDVEESSSKGSSIRCYVTHRVSSVPPSARVAQIVTNEEKRDYFTDRPFRRLAEYLDNVRRQLHQALTGIRAEGKSIAGYGASIGVTTILYHFELGSELDYLVDDNPLRVGLQSPGFALPVNAPSILTSPKKPDVVVILSWRYADAILAKNKAFLEQEGVFITILPHLQVIDKNGAMKIESVIPQLR